jgi:hypothetical protein
VTNAKGEEREAKSERRKSCLLVNPQSRIASQSGQRSMLRMAAPNGYEIFPGVEGVDVKKHGRDLIASRLAPALLSAVRGYGKAGPLAIVANSASCPETQLMPTAPFDFGFPREKVVAVIFRKVALVLDVQHGSHPRGIRCYYGRPCRRICAVTQRTLGGVGLPEAALLRFATASSRDAIPRQVKVDQICENNTSICRTTATFSALGRIKWENYMFLAEEPAFHPVSAAC